MKVDKRTAMQLAADDISEFDGTVVVVDLGDLGRQSIQVGEAEWIQYFDELEQQVHSDDSGMAEERERLNAELEALNQREERKAEDRAKAKQRLKNKEKLLKKADVGSF